MKRWVAAVVLGVVLATGGPAEAAPVSLHTRVSTYSRLYLSGHGSQAWLLLSDRCQDKVSRTRLQHYSSLARNLYGPLPIRTYDQVVVGLRARVTYTYAVSRLNQYAEPWVFQHGSWRYAQC